MTDTKFLLYEREHVTERWTGRVLRISVWTSACFMILGLLLAAFSSSSIVPISTNPSLGNLVEQLFSSTVDPITFLFAGLVMLMFTPVLRVITAIVGFAVERDWRFVIVSSVVLLMLAGGIVYSIFLKG